MKAAYPEEENHLFANQEATDPERVDEADIQVIPLTGAVIVPSADSKTLFNQTFKKLLLSTIPVALGVFVTFFNQSITMHFLKTRNDILITGAYGLAGSFMNITFLVIFLALNLGLVNCAAHVYGAAKYELVGLYYHRALVIHTIICVPCACFFYWSDKLCVMIDFDPAVAYYIQQLLSRCIPGMFAQMFFTTTVAYLNACGHFTIPGLFPPIGCLFYWIVGYYFIENLGLGIIGAAISYDLLNFFLAISIFVYVKFWDPVPNTFFMLRKASFTGLWRLLKYELLTGSMVYLEWIAFEIIAIFAGLLESKIQLAAVTIFFAHALLVGAIPLGLRDTVLAFVSQALGEKDTEKAKRTLKAAMLINIISIILLILYLIFLSKFVAGFYVEDLTTREQTSQYFLLLIFQIPADFTQCVLGSGLRALRKEKEGTILMGIGYYLVAVPVSYILGFVVNLGGLGLLIGLIVGTYCLLIGLFIMILQVNWDKQVETIQQEHKIESHVLELDKLEKSE